MIISNKQIKDIMKMVKSLKESGFLIKGVSETIENETKEQNSQSLVILLGKLAASLLRNMFRGKGVIRAGE